VSASGDKPLRSGLTTGTCAAAAAKAAAMVLAGEDVPVSVEVLLPGGDVVAVPVTWVEVEAHDRASAGVVKDAGDDPDITNGCTVAVSLELGGEGVRFFAGDGVGTVTRAGLQLEPGEPAINPVPREMIAETIAQVLGERIGVAVTVSIPGGAALAEKTFGPRLGIEGGLSIIGTSGRVEPKSDEAWMRSLLPQVDVARAAGHGTVWIAPGGIGERYATDVLGAPADAVVQSSNFVGALLDKCAEAGVVRVVLVGHAGKLVKVAAGLFDTHSRAGDARLETVAAVAAAEGAPGPLAARLLDLPTVQAAIEELEAAGLARVWDVIAARAAARAAQRCGLPVDVVLLGYGGSVLGGSGEFRTHAGAGAGVGELVVVGVGPGSDELLLPAAWREVRSAEVVAGGSRVLDQYAPEGAERIVVGGDVAAALAQVRERLADGRRCVVLASGDPGMFGILAAVRRELPDVPLRVVPGISSLQLALARLGESWEGVAVASAHGRNPEQALATCVSSPRTLVLVDSSTTPAVFSAKLAKRGAFEVTVLERLGYADERVTTADAAQVAAQEHDKLAVLFVRNRAMTEG
jgi:cobalt-precorrin-5B (C1)-methyltransferase